jgi:hypothetical protein
MQERSALRQGFLRTQGAADYLGSPITPSTLKTYRSRKKGPRITVAPLERSFTSGRILTPGCARNVSTRQQARTDQGVGNERPIPSDRPSMQARTNDDD